MFITNLVLFVHLLVSFDISTTMQVPLGKTCKCVIAFNSYNFKKNSKLKPGLKWSRIEIPA